MWLGLTAVGCGQQAGENTPPFIGTVVPDAGREVPQSTRDAAAPSGNQAGTTAAGSGGDSAPPPQDAAGAPADPAPTGDAQTGSAIAISPDDSLAVVVNRDVGSLSVLALDYDKEVLTELSLKKELPLGPGSEPYQAVFSPDGKNAYVILRRDQELLKIGSLASEPEIEARVRIGSEPTGLALDATGRKAFVANWSDGTLNVVDTEMMKVLRTVDLNAALVEAGYLGEVASRPALAHPRSVVVGAAALYVSEFFAQQLEAELPDGSNADTHKVGVVYKISLPDYTVSTIRLAALKDMGFRDERNGVAGCYPNQVLSLAINNGYVYALSVCASPEGPLG
ncbi:MAG TPA: cytochrome D1 domain-containing protein, partial [Polyangiales bacterium]|nr:cytochrome D1 domain-containing protein [Polyangiales bacterium]